MARREKIQIRRDEDLTEIDTELDDALERLENSNERVVELLKTIEGEGAEGESSSETLNADEAVDASTDMPAPPE